MENQVRLRWASHQGTVLSVFDALLSAETMVDVTLAADGQYLRAHKILLSACSPYFQELLSLDLNKNPIIFMKDVKYSELKALVQFIYRGEVNIAQEDLPSFLAVAQSLQIRGLASVDTPANNIGSDTLILPDFNNSSANSAKHTGPVPSSAMNMNTMTSFEHETTPVMLHSFRQPATTSYSPSIPHGSKNQSQPSVSIPDLRGSSNVPSGIPPPAKRVRVHQQRQHDPLDLNPVPVSISSTPVQSHSMQTSSQIFDPLSLSTQSTSQTTANLDQEQEQRHLMGHGMEEQAEPMFQAQEVKVEIGEGMQVTSGVYDEANEGEEGDNSMSQSSFTEGWKADESQDYEDHEEDDGEMPGGSGTGNESGTGGQAGGSGRSGEGGARDCLQCDKCGKQFSATGKGGRSAARSHLRDHSRFNCPFVPAQFQCRICHTPIRTKYNLRNHEITCSGVRERLTKMAQEQDLDKWTTSWTE